MLPYRYRSARPAKCKPGGQLTRWVLWCVMIDHNNDYPAISREQILMELDGLLSFAPVKSSRILQLFLKFIVHEKIANNNLPIKVCSIAAYLLGPSLTSQHELLVKTYALRLRKVVNSYYSGPGRYNAIKITLEKDTCLPIFSYNNYFTLPLS